MSKSHRSRRSRSSDSEDDRRRKRRRSTSSESDNDMKMEKKLDEERRKKKENKRLEKERMKQNETAEEKRLRRMEKKRRKEEKRKAKEEAETNLPPELSYTNLNNPFNDTKLTETFIWGKKLEKEGKSNLPLKQIKKETNKRIQRNLHEAAEFKKIRDARIAAREDMDMMQRDTDMKATPIWDSKEKEFQLDQVKERSRIRIEQGRAKAIDILTRYIRYNNEVDDKKDEDFELEDPISTIKSFCKSLDDLEDLIEDIKVYQTLEQDNRNDKFWKDVTTLTNEELKKRDPEVEGTVHSSVKAEVLKLFKGKSVEELCALEDQICDKLDSNSGNKGYWENLYEQVKVQIAKKRLKELHSKILKLKLARIREEQLKEIESSSSSSSAAVQILKKRLSEEEEEEQANKIYKKVDISMLEDDELDDEKREHRWRALSVEQLEEVTVQLYNAGNYSPAYNDNDNAMPGIEIIDAQADVEQLMMQREKNRMKIEGVDASEAKMLAIAKKGMEGDESTFSVEEKIETQKHLWSDKYRPRKPTYLNRVQTGFDWNKYNQTHYDMDNPPPKIVQGYKFNIFYPDLLDVTKTPTFTVTPCDDPDFAVVRFKAGPPYEDIAFKIVNREWEILHKHGYKCQFQNGVFQLWFTFKKYRYRR